MTITEAQRSRLYSGLEPILGQENAEVIMNSLNFEGTASLVTKEDLAELSQDMDRRFELMLERIDKKFLNMKIWFLVTGAGIALAVVNLYKK